MSNVIRHKYPTGPLISKFKALDRFEFAKILDFLGASALWATATTKLAMLHGPVENLVMGCWPPRQIWLRYGPLLVMKLYSHFSAVGHCAGSFLRALGHSVPYHGGGRMK